MSAVIVLRCDDGDCTTLYADDTATDWIARIHAEEHGWRCDEYGDHCPHHTPDHEAVPHAH